MGLKVDWRVGVEGGVRVSLKHRSRVIVSHPGQFYGAEGGMKGGGGRRDEGKVQTLIRGICLASRSALWG